jgi:malonate-semialdehyde dehydrogenase (acetylating)/methylmalonate-semialdehyde dehydrogenase
MSSSNIPHFIGGQRVAGPGDRYADVYNPATGVAGAQVPLASNPQVRAAVQNSPAAFPAWAATPPAQRTRILFRYQALLLLQNIDMLAQVVSAEHGKTLDDAKGSITRGIEVVEFACGIPQLLKGEHNEGVAGDIDMFSMRQSLGVCAGITPFNFPAMVPM